MEARSSRDLNTTARLAENLHVTPEPPVIEVPLALLKLAHTPDAQFRFRRLKPNRFFSYKAGPIEGQV
jgi:hypothetical protein